MFTASQDYQCIKDDADYYFQRGSQITAIRIDSILSNNDSLLYYNFPSMVWNEEIDCFDRNGPSWIGRNISVKPYGDNVFYNMNDIPITIMTLATPGDFWVCYNFENSDYIKATIAETQEMEFLELTDTVKTITFQAFNSNGTTLSHPINDKYIQLSKNYGLVRTINFNLFPDLVDGLPYGGTCGEYTLSGISNPIAGMQNLVLSTIFDFDIGDEVHTHWQHYYWDGYDEKNRYLKNYILDKQYNTTNDTVIYSIYRCGYMKHEYFTGNGWNTDYTYYEDTLETAYYIGNNGTIDALPGSVVTHETSPDYWQYSSISCKNFESTNRIMKKDLQGFFSFFPHECIYVLESKGVKDLGNDYNYYIEGVGGPYYYHFQVYDQGTEFDPVYYKKGNEEWGIPLAFDCDGYYTSIDQESKPMNLVEIAPNPMSEWTKIKINNSEKSKYTLLLFNTFGQKIKEFQFIGTEFILKRNGLKSGIYFYNIYNNEDFRTSGKLIVQ